MISPELLPQLSFWPLQCSLANIQDILPQMARRIIALKPFKGFRYPHIQSQHLDMAFQPPPTPCSVPPSASPASAPDRLTHWALIIYEPFCTSGVSVVSPTIPLEYSVLLHPLLPSLLLLPLLPVAVWMCRSEFHVSCSYRNYWC